MAQAVTFVVMAGGRGERLWPLVRSHRPKVCVAPDGKTSLIASTLKRLEGLSPKQQHLLVITHSQAKAIAKALPAKYHRAMVPEPQGKNTAACIALAASILSARDPEQVMVVLPADHWISPTSKFRDSLKAGIELARAYDRMVMIGLPATRVHTGLGHLCTGQSEGTRHGCASFRMVRFVEKPTPELAHELMRQYRTFWNAGIFIGRVSTFQSLIRRWLPDHAARLDPLGALAGTPRFARTLAAAYRQLEGISFDHGVMAHVDDGFVVEGGFAWEDLGSWDSWVRMTAGHKALCTVDSRNARAVSFGADDQHLITVVGLDDVIVIRTPDATVVCRADKAQSIRDAVTQLGRDPRLVKYL